MIVKAAMTHRPRLLVLSHVLPFPRNSGQQQRVFYTLQSARKAFHVTFATYVTDGKHEETEAQLLALCDDAVLLPAHCSRGAVSKVRHNITSRVYALGTGLRPSNYSIGEVEFSPPRIASTFSESSFDCVLYEYWHAVNSVEVFQTKKTPCVLDMHNILWHSYAEQLGTKWTPSWWNRWATKRYAVREEQAWRQFDGVIAINREEQAYAQLNVPVMTKVFYAPMGTDLTLWPYSWDPTEPKRVGYYGALGSPYNQQAALKCYTEIMPKIWQEFPDAELWLVGSNPSKSLQDLAADSRVKLTGYVETVQPILRTMSAVVCPWSGTFGFRSRFVEVLALGVPLVTSPDAVSGMELKDGTGVLLRGDVEGLVAGILSLMKDAPFASQQSQLAREQAVRLYSIENTYDKLIADLGTWLDWRKRGDKSC
ncbi:MAG: glycosyltransferase family 4 protein [Pyrinomonadaceae bacterium]|nr:glycosyltransferase family 4 protein [Pyrinomonadaceae bacterium]